MAKTATKKEQREKARRRTQWIYIGVIIAAAIAVVLLAVIPNIKPTVKVVYPNPNGTSIGSADAPVKVEAYSDFQCPYCGRYSMDQEPQTITKYIATGKVLFTFVPFSFIGPESFSAAEAAYCAADQNKFWEFKELLYKNQAGENTGGFSNANLKKYAGKAGLDMTAYTACFDGRKYQQKVLDDVTQGKAKGIQATPYFIVNEKGPFDMTQLDAAIDAALAGN